MRSFDLKPRALLRREALAALPLPPRARLLLLAPPPLPPLPPGLRALALASPRADLLSGLAAFDAALLDLDDPDDQTTRLALAWLLPSAPLVRIARLHPAALRQRCEAAGLVDPRPLPRSPASSLALRWLGLSAFLGRAPG